MSIAERLQTVVDNYSKVFPSHYAGEIGFYDEPRGFQGHSISDQQIKPYWEGTGTEPRVSFYTKPINS